MCRMRRIIDNERSHRTYPCWYSVLTPANVDSSHLIHSIFTASMANTHDIMDNFNIPRTFSFIRLHINPPKNIPPAAPGMVTAPVEHKTLAMESL